MSGQVSEAFKVGGSVSRLDAPPVEEFARYADAVRARPVVMTGALPASMRGSTWGPEALVAALGGRRVVVYVSVDGTFPGGLGPYDPAKYRRVEMTLEECMGRLSGADFAPVVRSGERYYLYQMPFGEGDEPELLRTCESPRYAGPGPLRRNLWVSGPGNVTPPHFDSYENLLAQLAGRKRVLLWSPEDYDNLRINPLGTRHDRQSAIDLRAPDAASRAALARAVAWEAELGPGDVLYIPMGWIHYVETIELSVSVNYWWPLDGGRGGLLRPIGKAVLVQGLLRRSPPRAELDALLRYIARDFVRRPPLSYWRRALGQAAARLRAPGRA